MEPEGSLRVHNSPPLVRILSQMNPVHIFSPYFPKAHSHIILPRTPRSSKRSLPFKFSDQNSVCIHLPQACYMPRPLIFLDLVTLISYFYLKHLSIFWMTSLWPLTWGWWGGGRFHAAMPSLFESSLVVLDRPFYFYAAGRMFPVPRRHAVWQAEGGYRTHTRTQAKFLGPAATFVNVSAASGPKPRNRTTDMVIICHDRLISEVTGYWAAEVRFPEGKKAFLLSMPRPVLGLKSASHQMDIEPLSPVATRPEHKADHSPPSSVDVKNAWSSTSTHPTRIQGVCLVTWSTLHLQFTDITIILSWLGR
jgi:hypothetical protein